MGGVADALEVWRDSHARGDMAGFGEPWNAAMAAWAADPVRPDGAPASSETSAAD